jgi:hypothetical protein
MSNQNEFNTKAIELTHDDLECVVGGNDLQDMRSSLAASREFQASASALQQEASMQQAATKALSELVKGIKA